MKNQTKILIVDDHALFRSGLRFLLEQQGDFYVIGEATDGLEAIKLTKQFNPDLVLLDLDMPVMNGKEALHQLLKLYPSLLILMLTVSEDSEDLTDCIKIGARGYLLKSINIDILLDGINRVLAGENILSPTMTNALLNSIRSPKQDDKIKEIESLTGRELQTLIRISKGDSNKVIARALDITESTVKVYVQNILRKLNLKSRVQAAIYVIENNLDKEESII